MKVIMIPMIDQSNTRSAHVKERKPILNRCAPKIMPRDLVGDLYRICITLLLSLCYSCASSASNAPYIAISNNIAKQAQLDVVANNAANIHTTGFEQDDVIYKQVDKEESKKKTNSFVVPRGNYRKSAVGGLKVTNNPLDLAIIGPGYFKVLTPRGPRYTLAGHFLINSQNVIVNADGYPVLSKGSQPIVLPDKRDYLLLEVAADGTVHADTTQIESIGIFGFATNTALTAELTREGAGLYASSKPDIAFDNDVATIQGGALRASNVNSTKVLTTMVELERSADASRQLVTDLTNLERSAIAKIMK